LAERQLDYFVSVYVVVGDPDLDALERARGRAAAIFGGLTGEGEHRRGRRARQVDREGRAAARPGAVGAHLAAVQQRDVAHEREADAQAARAPRRRSIGLAEAVEDVRQEFRLEADAVVLHLQL